MLGRSNRSIQIWFQNKRAKLKAKLLSQNASSSKTKVNVTEKKERVCSSPRKKMDSDQYSKETNISFQFDPFPGIHKTNEYIKIPALKWEVGTCEYCCEQYELTLCLDMLNKQVLLEIGRKQLWKRLEFDYFDIFALCVNYSTQYGSLSMNLLRPPRFSEFTAKEDWTYCSDFTQNFHASIFRNHNLYFPKDVLAKLIEELKSLHPRFSDLLVVTNFSLDMKQCFDFVSILQKQYIQK